MHLGDVLADYAYESKAKHQTCRHANAGDHHALAKNIGENVARLSAQSDADSELARAPAHGKCEHTSYAHNGN